jgi:hypothetical protein
MKLAIKIANSLFNFVSPNTSKISTQPEYFMNATEACRRGLAPEILAPLRPNGKARGQGPSYRYSKIS